MKTIAILLLLAGCATHVEAEPDPERVFPRATQCDGSGQCVTCDGRPERRLLISTPEGLWNPATDQWELVDETEAGLSWCRAN